MRILIRVFLSLFKARLPLDWFGAYAILGRSLRKDTQMQDFSLTVFVFLWKHLHIISVDVMGTWETSRTWWTKLEFTILFLISDSGNKYWGLTYTFSTHLAFKCKHNINSYKSHFQSKHNVQKSKNSHRLSIHCSCFTYPILSLLKTSTSTRDYPSNLVSVKEFFRIKKTEKNYTKK